MEPTQVSVIIPIYNVSKYLRTCLDSVCAQTLTALEIICVNDGSTDSCPAILAEYAAKDSRIRVIDKPNTGYGDTMNVGIAAASGSHVGIVEPDDFILPEMYATLYAIATKNNMDLIKSDFYRFRTIENGRERIYTQLSKNAVHLYNRIIDPGINLDVFRFAMNTWTGLYKASFLRENHILHNTTPGASFQDNGFFFQTLCLSRRAWFLDRAFYMNRRDNPDSSVNNHEKVYAMCDEHDFIYRFLCQDPERLARFLPVFQRKRFENYEFTLARIAPTFRPDFLRRYQKDLTFSQEKGELDLTMFSDYEKKLISMVLQDPGKYLKYRTSRHPQVLNRIQDVVTYNQLNGMEATIQKIIEKIHGSILPGK